MTLSVNSRNVAFARRQLIQGGVALGLCDENGNPLSDHVEMMDKTLCSEEKEYLEVLTDFDLQGLAGKATPPTFNSCKPAEKLIALLKFLKRYNAPLESLRQLIHNNDNRDDYLSKVGNCRTKYQERGYWTRFKKEFKSNPKFRLAIYCLIGVAVVALAVLTAGIGVGIAAAVAGSASVSAGIASAFAWGAAVSTASLVFGSLYTAAAGIASGLIAWVFGSKKTSPAPVVQQSSSAVPVGNNADTALAARASVQQEMENKPEVAPAPAVEQESGCMAFVKSLWAAYEVTHSALPRNPQNQPGSSSPRP